MAYHTTETIVYLNGKWIPAAEANVSLYNQTMHYGNGVFEGIRAYDAHGSAAIFKPKAHYQRMIDSAKTMHIPFSYSVKELTDISHQLLEKNKLKDAYIRPLIFLDPMMSLVPVEKSNLFVCAWEWGRYLGSSLLRLMTSSYQRPNPKSVHVEAKTVGHYVNSILATTEAKQKGFDEAILLDQNGFVAEGPGANFFYEKYGILYTCPLGNILPGITRATMFELAAALGIEIHEKQTTMEEVKQADSAFFTGTAAEVAGIGSIDDYSFPLDWEESIGKKLSDAYQLAVRKI